MSKDRVCLACGKSDCIQPCEHDEYEFECTNCGYWWSTEDEEREEGYGHLLYRRPNLEFNLAGQLVDYDDD